TMINVPFTSSFNHISYSFDLTTISSSFPVALLLVIHAIISIITHSSSLIFFLLLIYLFTSSIPLIHLLNLISFSFILYSLCIIYHFLSEFLSYFLSN